MIRRFKSPLRRLLTIGLMLLLCLVLHGPAAHAKKVDLDAIQDRFAESMKAGEYSKAERLAKQMLAIVRKRFGKNHNNYAIILHNLAYVYEEQGRYSEAYPLYRQALKIKEKRLGKSHTSVAITLINLANLYQRQGLYSKVDPLYQRALNILKKKFGRTHPHVAVTFNNLAVLYRFQGRYSEAIKLHERALAIQKKKLGPTHPDVAMTIGNLAVVYRDQGRSSEAVQLYQRALEIQEKKLGLNHPDVASTLGDLAFEYNLQGRYAEAVALFRRALKIQEKTLGQTHPKVGHTLNQFAIVHLNLGRKSDAADLFRRSHEILNKKYGPAHPETAIVLSNLAELYGDQGRYTKAVELYSQAIKVQEKTLGPDHQYVAVMLNGLGTVYRSQDRFAEADPLFQRALGIMEKQLGQDHAIVAETLNNLAILHEKQGAFADALSYGRRAVTASSGSQKRASAAQVVKSGAQKPARDEINETFVRIAYSAAGQDRTQRQTIANDAFAVSQRYKTTSVAAALSQMAARFGVGKQGLGKVVREQQDAAFRWQASNSNLIKELSQPPDKRDERREAALRKELAAAEARVTGLLSRLENDFPDYKELTNPKPLDVAEVQRLLGTDEALVSYLVLNKATYVWAITNDEMQWHKLGPSTSQEELAGRVAALRKSLEPDVFEAGDVALFNLMDAHQLYTDLLNPVEDLIRDKKRLLVVASGALTSLPFHVLVSKKPGVAVPEDIAEYKDAAWLVKRHAVTILPSVSSLRSLRVFARKGQAKKVLIGYGNPDFGSGNSAAVRGTKVASLKTGSISSLFTRDGLVDAEALGSSLPSLPDTEDELKKIARQLGVPESQIRLRSAATEKDVKNSKLDRYRIVYFATHGLVAGDLEKLGAKRAEPALALTIPKKPNSLDDGLLTASEIAQLKLNADMVVLSACNTAAGDKPGAEALSGLAKSFIYAGARSLLVSHWPVVSSAAVKLTTGIFDAQEKDSDIGKAEALRRSMLAMMNDPSDPINAYPLIWAPFIVVGEGG